MQNRCQNGLKHSIITAFSLSYKRIDFINIFKVELKTFEFVKAISNHLNYLFRN